MIAADEERADREHAGLLDHLSDDWWDEADWTEPEPLPVRPAATRLCQWDRPGRWRGERRCLGSFTGGACERCGRPERKAS